MSEKERQKKEGRNKDKKNKAMRKPVRNQQSPSQRVKDKPAMYGEELPRNDRTRDNAS